MSLQATAEFFSSAFFVVVIGLGAMGVMLYDITRRELGAVVDRTYRLSGVALTAVFIALVALRFNTLSA